MIPYGRQKISSEDITAVTGTLYSDFLTQGPAVPEFESAILSCTKAAYGVAVNSGTSALHLACLALGVDTGDRVWTSPNTYVASANCARYCGAEVDFIDIDPETRNMSVPVLKSRLEAAEADGNLPAVVIPVHFAGQPCDMNEIAGLGERYGFRIIEDAAHALGATYLDSPVGACVYSDITVFSFHPVKMITTGEGGMAVTNDVTLADRMRLLRSHGINRNPAGGDPWRYTMTELGFNYRMTDIQAALGLSQLRHLDDFVKTRNKLAAYYDSALGDLPLSRPVLKPDRTCAWHLYVVNLVDGTHGLSRRQLYDAMIEAGVGVNVHYYPVYKQPYYRHRYGDTIKCMEAEHYYESALTLPLHPGLSREDQDHVVTVLHRLLN